MNESHYNLISTSVRRFNNFRRQHQELKIDLSKADLRGRDLRNADFNFINLEGANLESADLQGANLVSSNLKNVNLKAAHLKHVKAMGANFAGADLTQADLSNANLTSTCFWRARLHKTNLSHAIMIAAEFLDADLQEAVLSHAKLNAAKFNRAHLEGADLGNADFNEAVLEQAHLNQTHLDQADLRGAYIAGMEISPGAAASAHLEGAHREHLDALEVIEKAEAQKQHAKPGIRVPAQVKFLLLLLILAVSFPLWGHILNPKIEPLSKGLISSYVYLKAGDIYLTQGKTDQALEQYLKAVKAKPDLAVAYFELAYCYDVKNNHQECLAALKSYLKYTPKVKDMDFVLETVHKHAKSADAAEVEKMLTKFKDKD
jgi:uncharacterized protein YjbI with pentapeptide repeats